MAEERKGKEEKYNCLSIFAVCGEDFFLEKCYI